MGEFQQLWIHTLNADLIPVLGRICYILTVPSVISIHDCFVCDLNKLVLFYWVHSNQSIVFCCIHSKLGVVFVNAWRCIFDSVKKTPTVVEDNGSFIFLCDKMYGTITVSVQTVREGKMKLFHINQQMILFLYIFSHFVWSEKECTQ